ARLGGRGTSFTFTGSGQTCRSQLPRSGSVAGGSVRRQRCNPAIHGAAVRIYYLAAERRLPFRIPVQQANRPVVISAEWGAHGLDRWNPEFCADHGPFHDWNSGDLQPAGRAGRSVSGSASLESDSRTATSRRAAGSGESNGSGVRLRLWPADSVHGDFVVLHG